MFAFKLSWLGALQCSFFIYLNPFIYLNLLVSKRSITLFWALWRANLIDRCLEFRMVMLYLRVYMDSTLKYICSKYLQPKEPHEKGTEGCVLIYMEVARVESEEGPELDFVFLTEISFFCFLLSFFYVPLFLLSFHFSFSELGLNP